MNQLNVYLTFNGNAAEAMRFYAEALGGQLQLMKVGESPIADQIPNAGANANLIMHANLVLPQGSLMASDWMEGCGPAFDGMKGFALTITYPTAAEAQSRFEALAEGGQINMPLGKTFWAEIAGGVIDRFGTPWMVNGGEMLGG
ncbi:hypothetical protein IGB42_02052 [Andreprevotia sp. IGB-42]|uniref:VOC family protein n=1 Tax=Andreprevotia sp. IGB-42 TaxID=2497473 RepID=UPI001358DD86|nr:VOC family protein [Andreprevotia sp. IGB-42]KAF0813699.1 hypothetical protein IGB42_02052 [Andreprevotia sp. IGB-42]